MSTNHIQLKDFNNKLSLAKCYQMNLQQLCKQPIITLAQVDKVSKLALDPLQTLRKIIQSKGEHNFLYAINYEQSGKLYCGFSNQRQLKQKLQRGLRIYGKTIGIVKNSYKQMELHQKKRLLDELNSNPLIYNTEVANSHTIKNLQSHPAKKITQQSMQIQVQKKQHGSKALKSFMQEQEQQEIIKKPQDIKQNKPKVVEQTQKPVAKGLLNFFKKK